jgi:hypothetical protein
MRDDPAVRWAVRLGKSRAHLGASLALVSISSKDRGIRHGNLSLIARLNFVYLISR